MRIADLFAQKTFVLSFEVFPPKTDAGREAMYATIEKLAIYQPGFISCTYGAGGTTQAQTLEIVDQIRTRYGITTTAHLTCVGSTVAELKHWLGEAIAKGVSNIMALRGDPPKGQEAFVRIAGGLAHANELVALIRHSFPQLGIGVAGYPETHQEAPSPSIDLANLKRKVDAGADAVFTQLFYDNTDFWRFRDDCVRLGIRVPVVPGILPIVNFPQIQRITKLCKARIPQELHDRLEKNQDSPIAQIDIGVEWATQQCEELRRGGVPGIHFYVLNQSEATSRVLENLSSDRVPALA